MDLLIFDMDGVLIDVSGSYRKTIQHAVRLYLETCLGLKTDRRELVTLKDIFLFKSAGGFNNDWDLTSGLLFYLLSISGIPPFHTPESSSSIGELISRLEAASSGFRLRTGDLIPRKDIPSFAGRVKSSGGGLAGIHRVLGSLWDGWLYRSGDLDRTNLVKRIFQEIYLGKQFRVCHGLSPLFYRGPGYYLREHLLIPAKILTGLRKRFRTGIASGRPRFEAELALNRFRLTGQFDAVVTLDECREEERRTFRNTGKRVALTKPHPYSILRVARETGLRKPSCGYIGDVVDDMRAARRAGRELDMLAIGFVPGGKKGGMAEELLLQSGADLIVRDPEELLDL
jgi:HAD superfamily phosphatase